MKTTNSYPSPTSLTTSHVSTHTAYPTFRPLQDWANRRPTPIRGLRHDLRRLFNYLSRYASEAIMALIWASIIPSMTILGSLVGY